MHSDGTQGGLRFWACALALSTNNAPRNKVKLSSGLTFDQMEDVALAGTEVKSDGTSALMVHAWGWMVHGKGLEGGAAIDGTE